jgi:hypothetical protein
MRPLLSNAYNVAAASGSIDVDVRSVNPSDGVFFLANLSALAGGTTPSVDFVVYAVDEFGNEHQMFDLAGAAITAAPALKTKTFHPALQDIFTKTLRLKWTTTGAPTTATLQLSVYDGRAM